MMGPGIFIKYVLTFLFISFLLVSLFPIRGFCDSSPTEQGPGDTGNGSPASGYIRHPVMHFTPLQLQEHESKRALMPTVESTRSEPLPAGSKSLISDLPYLGNTRDQGFCGNCWVWASTGALEIAHKVTNNVNSRLSIQYFNSNWNGGASSGNACSGGYPSDFAGFYSDTLKKAIPWSNTNASFADYDWFGEGSLMDASSISTSPNYPLTSVSDTVLSTHSGQINAINVIKSQINANTPVIYVYSLPSDGWVAFNTFWYEQPDSAIWNPDTYNDGYWSGRHAVLIVGYDDTASTPYWIVLNSYGTTALRPNGTFNLAMNIDYDGQMKYGYMKYYSHEFEIFNTVFSTPTPTPTVYINSSANEWGIVVPRGNISYPAYTNQSYFTQSKPGADVQDVFVNAKSQGAIDNWTFTNLTANQDMYVKSIPVPGQVHAMFNATPRYGAMPLLVNFSDASIGSPTSFLWQFGDGYSNTSKNTTHTYTLPGIYSVSLQAMNDQTGGYCVWNDVITVTNGVIPKPSPIPVPGEITPGFTIFPESGKAPLGVRFTDSSTGNPVSWFWNFGDGSTSDLQNPYHQYTGNGSYGVTLSVNNGISSGTLQRPQAVLVG